MKKVAIIIISFIIGIGLGIAIMFVLNKNTSNEKVNNSNIKENNSKKINDDSLNNNNKNEVNTQILKFYPDSIAVLANGEVYVNVYGSTDQIDDLFYEGTYEEKLENIGKGEFQNLVKTREKYQTYKFDNIRVLDAMNYEFKGMKLNISNIKAVYSFAEGQVLDKNYGIFLLDNNGKLYGIFLYSMINGIVEVKEISGLSNIEKLVTKANDGMFTYAVDKNNKEYYLYDYVPKDYKQW